MKALFSITTIVMFFTIVNSCAAQQNKMLIEDIKEILVYNHFNSMGYTRGSALRKFKELENNKTTKIPLDTVFVNSFKSVLISSAKHKKLIPSKCGTELIFAQFVFKDGSRRDIIIASNGVFDYYVGNMGYFFIDSVNEKNKEFWINTFFSKIVAKVR